MALESLVSPSLERLGDELRVIRADMLEAEERFLVSWSDIPASHLPSARNLLHYLALRRRDLRLLQAHLASFGLSSLGRAESQAFASVQAVLDAVRHLADLPADASLHEPPVSFAEGRALLDAHTRALLGPPPTGRDVRIMVTMPAEAASEFELVRDLVMSGMDCMRVNTAHDDPDAWDRMLRHLERATAELRRPCRVLIDLAGPKLRTGLIEPGPPVLRWRPERDVYGRVERPARIWLTDRDSPRGAPRPAAAALPVNGRWLGGLAIDDKIELHDARNAHRTLRVVGREEGGVWVEGDQTAYVLPGTLLKLSRKHNGRRHAEVGELPPTVQPIMLAPGDTLILARDIEIGHPAVVTDDGEVMQPAEIPVTLPQIFDDVRAGESVWLDDGKIGGVVRSSTGDRIEVTITHAKPEGSKLGSDKGINLPDSNLRLPALTPKDLQDLPFIARRADLIGYSFVRTEQDVRELQARLVEAAGEGQPGLVLKIETRRAFDNLPALLLAAMRSPAAGVMIARGDLAVECGYERLAEVQEEILWMAEASHTPVIWATQVLEGLTKSGIPSRAEITDAAMGERAECVMLNKGPYIVDAVRALDSILSRMQAHQRKKSPMLRQLGLADRFLDGEHP
jgi:pyruvate kinase